MLSNAPHYIETDQNVEGWRDSKYYLQSLPNQIVEAVNKVNWIAALVWYGSIRIMQLLRHDWQALSFPVI